MKLLYLQNGPRRRSVSALEDRFAAAGFDVDVRWAYQGEFPDDLAPYGACFVSGSPHGAYENIPWIEREHGLLRDLAGRGVPMLGICFGSGRSLNMPRRYSAICATCAFSHFTLMVRPSARTCR